MAGSVDFIISIEVKGAKVQETVDFDVPDGAVTAAPLDIALTLLTIAEDAISRRNEADKEAILRHWSEDHPAEGEESHR
jgi:hypothetical protein